MRAPRFLRRPTGALVAALLAVLAWRLVATLLAPRPGESLIASMTFLAVAGLAILPFWVALRLRPRLGWDSRRTHLLGFAGFLALHVPIWLVDRASVFGDPGFLDRFMLLVGVFAAGVCAASHGHVLQAEGSLKWPEKWVSLGGVAGVALGIILASALPGAAHTPGFGTGIGTIDDPVLVPGDAGGSWALLQRMAPGDVVVLARDVPAGTPVDGGVVLLATRENVLGPFRPWVAVAGPGFPAPEVALPVPLPPGWGAVVGTTWEGRGVEGFSEVPILDGPFVAPVALDSGRHLILVWEPQGDPGEAWIALGHLEGIRLQDFHIFPASWLEVRSRFW